MCTVRSQVLSLLLMVSVCTVAAAQDPRFGAPSGNKVKKALESQPQRSELLFAHRDTFPVFVFIPGVMGSKLYKTEGKKKREIFGTFDILNPSDSTLIYDEAEAKRISTALLDEFAVDYLVGKHKTNIYGTAIKTIAELSTRSGTDVLVFPYDWRQPNARSAEALTDWFCRAKEMIGGRPVVFVAHSMGGLILKHWLKNFYESKSCDNESAQISQWLKVKRITFLGTPHYGAPQALFAFAEAYYLLYEPLDSKKASRWQWLKERSTEALDRLYFSRSINAYGATFPSGYQLLPITGTKCFPADQTPPVSVTLTSPDPNLNIFDGQSWKSFGWPVSKDDSVKKILADKLQKYLESAEEFLCGLADYKDIDKKYEVMRFFGDKKDTICKITITGADANSNRRKIKYDLCADRGDGTVPRWTAAEAGRIDPKLTRALSEPHVSLAGAKEFIDYLRGSFNEFHRTFQQHVMAAAGNDEARQNEYKTALINIYTQLEVFIPRASPLTPADNLTGEINRAVAKNLEVSADEIYDGAWGKGRAERADGLRVYSDLIEDPDLQTSQAISDIRYSWAMNNVAHNFLQRRDFVRASIFASRAIEAIDVLSNDNVRRIGIPARRIKGLAALTAAISAKELKDEAGRRQYCEMALANGNQKARQAACR